MSNTLRALSALLAYPTEDLRAAIAEWYQRRRGVTVAPDAVLPTVGSKELVALMPMLLGIGAGEAVVGMVVQQQFHNVAARLAYFGAVGLHFHAFPHVDGTGGHIEGDTLDFDDTYPARTLHAQVGVVTEPGYLDA